MKMSYFFDANFLNAKNCKNWHFLKYQCFRFFIISPIIFDLQECIIPQIKAKDISFWPHFLRCLAKINTLWDGKQSNCLIFLTQTSHKHCINEVVCAKITFPKWHAMALGFWLQSNIVVFWMRYLTFILVKGLQKYQRSKLEVWTELLTRLDWRTKCSCPGPHW